MDRLWQDVRYGIRILGKSPGFAAVAVLTLALGIGANTMIFSVVNGVLLRPLPYSEPQRLVALAEVDPDDDEPVTTSFGTMEEWKQRSLSFEGLALHRGWQPTLLGEGEPERLRAKRVSASFFRVLGVRPALGRDFRPDEESPDRWHVIMLSHGLWQRSFGGDPNVIGKPVSLGGSDYTVIGVLPRDFQPVFFASAAQPIELWAPLGYAASQPWACRSCRHLQAVGRLKAGVTLSQARAEMNTLEQKLIEEFPKDYHSASRVAVTPMRERLVGNVRPALVALLGAVGFVLLIGCANVANLLLARASGRQRETAIRTALGASRGRLIRQALTESTVLALAGAGAGWLLASWGISALVALAPVTIPRLDEIAMNWPVFLLTLGISTLTGMLIGLAPALRPSWVSVSNTLKEGGRTATEGAGHRSLRGLLVSSEIALAMVLLTGAGLLIKSFVQLVQVDPGLDPANVLTLETYVSGPRYEEPVQIANFYREVFERIRSLPGVTAVGTVTPLPLDGSFDRASLHIEGRAVVRESDLPSADRYYISGDYLAAMRIPLVRGRAFTADEMYQAAPVALVSETLARTMWPGGDPLGQRIKLGGSRDPWVTIVGVVGDVRHYGLDTPPTLQAYLPSPNDSGYLLSLVVRTTQDPASLAAAVKQQIWSVDKDRPAYGVMTMERVLGASLAQRRFTMNLIGVFAAVALLLAMVGIYGVMSYSVAQRTHEIGVRMALGAQPGEVFRMILGHGMALAGIGVAIGAAAALGVTRLMAGLLHQVSAADLGTYAWVAVLLAGVALLACYVPARRATKVDPMVALRYE